MSYPDLTDEECNICGSYHTIFVCQGCYNKLRKELIEEFEKMLFELGFTDYNDIDKRKEYIKQQLQEMKEKNKMVGNSKFTWDEIKFRKELDRRIIELRIKYPNKILSGTWRGIAQSIKDISPKLKCADKLKEKQ